MGSTGSTSIPMIPSQGRFSSSPMGIPQNRLDAIPRSRPKCSDLSTIGKSFTIAPHLPPDNLVDELPWKWFDWKCGNFNVFTVIQIVLAILAVTAVGLLFGRGTRVVGGVLLFIVGGLFFLYVWVKRKIRWNFRMRELLCYVKGKKVQAEETWYGNLSSNTQKDRAKEVFYVQAVGQTEVSVLKEYVSTSCTCTWQI